MNFQLNFETGKDISSLIGKTKKYFAKKGFKLVKEEQEYLEFKKRKLDCKQIYF